MKEDRRGKLGSERTGARGENEKKPEGEGEGDMQRGRENKNGSSIFLCLQHCVVLHVWTRRSSERESGINRERGKI